MTSTPEFVRNDSDGEVIQYRSLEHLELQQQETAGSGENQELLDLMHREFPDDITEPPFEAADAVSRRGFLGVVAASAALAGLTSCRKPKVKILPFNKRPEGMVPGVPRHYATAHDAYGYGIGTLVRSSDGRPTKVEGNPLHPASEGAASVFMQGDLLNLYDPARARHIVMPAAIRDAEIEKRAHAHDGEEEGEGHDDHDGGHHHEEAAEEVDHHAGEILDAWLLERSNSLLNTGGSGLAILMAPTSSPSTQALVQQVRDAFPSATIAHWQPIHRDAAIEGSEIAFGRAMDTHYDLEKATCIVSLDADFLGSGPDHLRMSRGFARSRRVEKKGDTMSRLYSIESCYSVTGGQADHRFRLRASDVSSAAAAIAGSFGVEGVTGGKNFDWLQALVEDLRANGGGSVVIPGPSQPAAIHALCHAINRALGSVGSGKVVTYTPTDAGMAVKNTDSIVALANAMGKGEISTLLCLGCNPVYDAPADLEFAEKLKQVNDVVYLSNYHDETAHACLEAGDGQSRWFVPMAHGLEAWRDLRATDGTLSIAQPLIAPLHGGLTPAEVIARFIDHVAKDSHGIVRAHWELTRTSGFEAWWNESVHDGVCKDTQNAPETAALNEAAVTNALASWKAPAAGSATNVELVFAEDPKVLDGRYANNAWLQELPHPMTKLTWDNAALMSRATAEALGVTNGDLVKISSSGIDLEIAAFILPGHADWSITLPLGYGRTLPEDCEVAHGGKGFNTYALRTSSTQSVATGASVTKAGGSYELVTTQDHGTMAGRDLIRSTSIDHYNKTEDPLGDVEWFAPMMDPLAKVERESHHGKERPAKDIVRELQGDQSLWKEREYNEDASPFQWAMTIDLNACTGCNACVVACVSENNIPSVGKTQVARGREMHWIRIDRYFEERDRKDGQGKLEIADDPTVSVQPVPCMQCENAPCESVCPVAATVHSPEGLNDMAYNRCIGTRYCSNNCPYKVRRFNWLDYRGKVEDTEKLAFNPDVTIRSRGVMEKCTFCVQRINGAKIEAKRRGERTKIADGAIKPACAQTCASEAITFGNMLDADSQIAKKRRSPANYGLLSQLNTRPRATYLARFKNPNPKLSTKKA